MEGPGDKRRAAPWAAAVALAAAVPFLGTLGHGFALDDAVEVVRNDQLRSLGNLPRMFTTGAWAGAGEANPLYRPLTTFSYALDFALGGLTPVGYHVTNVLLHVAVSLLVLALARRLGFGPIASAAGAVLFAVHPVHVEAVANVAGRKDVLATGFTILTVLAHARAVQAARPWPALVWPPLALLAALLAKESGAAAIPLALGFTLVVEPEPWRAARRRVVGLGVAYLGVFALYLGLRWNALGTLSLPLSSIPWVENPLAYADPLVRVLTAVVVLGHGLGVLVFPRTLGPDWSYEAIPLARGVTDPRFVLALVAIVAVLAAGWLVRRARPPLAYLVLWYAAGVFLTSNLVLKVGTVFGERLLYLSSVAFCLGAVMVVKLAAERVEPGGIRVGVGRLVPVVGSILLVVLAARAWAYAGKWRDEVTLFETAVRAAPGSAKARLLLGAAYMEEERTAEGVAALEAGVARLAAAPFDAGPRIQLGVAYERAGRTSDAGKLYEELLAGHPDLPDALWRLGVVRWQQGRRDISEALWRKALEVDPMHARAMTDLGLLLQARGDLGGAEALWLRAAQADPLAAGPWLQLGSARLSRGDVPGARAAWGRFLELARYGVYPGQREVVEAKLKELQGR
ncbi:MAG: tetratricopeptide repeat protein [Anaeromyxobacteraceae bacterium]